MNRFNKANKKNPFASLVDDIKRAKDGNNDSNHTVIDMPIESDNLNESSIQQLDKEIKNLKTKIQQNVWLIGQRLSTINNNKLYKDLNYETFTEYLKNELLFSERTAFKYISIFKAFKLEKIKDVDSEKLYLLTQIKDENRRMTLLEITVKEKLSYRVLKETIKNRNLDQNSNNNTLSFKHEKDDYFPQNKTIIINKHLKKKQRYNLSISTKDSLDPKKWISFIEEVKNIARKYNL